MPELSGCSVFGMLWIAAFLVVNLIGLAFVETRYRELIRHLVHKMSSPGLMVCCALWTILAFLAWPVVAVGLCFLAFRAPTEKRLVRYFLKKKWIAL